MKKKNIKTDTVIKTKPKGLGFFEKIPLKYAGNKDGSRKMLRKDADGNPTSPFLDREINSYEKYISETWGNLQKHHQDSYAQLSEYKDKFENTSKELAAARKKLTDVIELEKSTDTTARKYGEENLTDEQVKARRTRESKGRLTPYTEEIDCLEKELKVIIKELSDIRGKVIEEENSTRIACNRVKDHMMMRADVYWNSAMHKHPDKLNMPVTPSLQIDDRAEKLYLLQHEKLMQDIAVIVNDTAEKKEA